MGMPTEGPPAKKQKAEEDLEPEPEYGTDSSIVKFDVEISAPISELKQQIQDRYGMPNSKQKLVSDVFFIKDNLSSAFYNLNN